MEKTLYTFTNCLIALKSTTCAFHNIIIYWLMSWFNSLQLALSLGTYIVVKNDWDMVHCTLNHVPKTYVLFVNKLMRMYALLLECTFCKKNLSRKKCIQCCRIIANSTCANVRDRIPLSWLIIFSLCR